MVDLLLDSSLYKELDRRAKNNALARELRGLIDSSLNAFDDVLREVRRYFHTYTDHALAHSCRVVSNMSRLLSPGQVKKLSSVELYLLIASALVHDIGMVVSEEDVVRLLESGEYRAEKTALCKHLGIKSTKADDRYGLFRMVVAEHFRKRHGERCALVVEEGSLGCLKLTGGDGDLARKLADVCVGHTLTREDIVRCGRYSTGVQVRSQDVNVLFCTTMLRLGDLLDITTARASPVLRELSEPLEPLSAAHWDQYKKVELGVLGPKKPIYVGGTCPTQAAERLLREWVKWLEDECEWAVLTMNVNDDHYRLNLGRVTYDVKPEKGKDGRPLYEFHTYRFNLDEEEVFQKLFGSRLYGRPEAALRELLQNAIDATRVRAALVCSERPGWEALSESAKRQHYLEELDAHPDQYRLKAELSSKVNPKTGCAETWMTIADSGVGMSRDVIEKYLLKVGRSRWRDDPRTQSLGICTIGEFGIGFISAFMVSDQIVIDTQSCLPDDEGIRAIIYNWKGYLATEPISPGAPGTQVNLLLRPDAAERLNNFVEHVEHWCPFPEVPIEVRSLDGSTHTVPVRGRKGYSKEERRVYFRIGEGFSFATISENQIQLTENSPPSLAQEGIAIPDVPPPIQDTPEQRILRERGLRVNLFGAETTRLDLSRNITEGGYEQLWERLVPLVWQGLARHSLRSKAGHALAELVQTKFEQSLGSYAFLLQNERIFWLGEIDDLTSVDSLSFVDYKTPYFQDGWQEPENLLILPEPPAALITGIDLETAMSNRVDAVTQYWAELGGHLKTRITHDEDDVVFEEDDDHDNEDDDAHDNATVRSPRVADLLANPAFDGFDDDTPVSLLTFLQYKPHLFRRYRFVSQSRGGYARLHINKPAGDLVYSLQHLGLFQLSLNWWAIRNPISGDWNIISRYDIEMAEDSIPDKAISMLTFEQLATVYLYDLWPDPNNWAAGWPISRPAEYGRSIRKAFFAHSESKIADPYNDDDDVEDDENEDDDVKGDEHEDAMYRASLSPGELRRIDRHGVSAEKSNSILADLVIYVLPQVDTTRIATCLTDWDRQAWHSRCATIRLRSARSARRGRSYGN